MGVEGRTFDALLDPDPPGDDRLDTRVRLVVRARHRRADGADLVLQLRGHVLHEDLGVGGRVYRELHTVQVHRLDREGENGWVLRDEEHRKEKPSAPCPVYSHAHAQGPPPPHPRSPTSAEPSKHNTFHMSLCKRITATEMLTRRRVCLNIVGDGC